MAELQGSERRGLFSRALSGGALTAGAFAASQALRLGSNLILTRLLYPEAFGVMALVTMVLVGLQMFSDTGIGPAISRSPRGDEPGFLNTAWTVNVIRGLLLWGLTALAAWPMARFYEVPELAQLLPVAGLALCIAGFNPTRIDTANRHLMLGRVTLVELAAQVAGTLFMVVLAVATRSVWALVAGAVLAALAKLLLARLWLPGEPNRLHWEPTAAAELIHFGKWIFLSTACGFLLAQGDKAILGAYLTMSDLGIYNTGFFLASFPMAMAVTVVAKIMIPLYRDHPPAGSIASARNMRRLRLVMATGVLVLLAAVAMAGGPLVAALYDPRYHAAGSIVTAVALVQMLQIPGMTYDQSALAAGDGRGFFLLLAFRAVLQTSAFLIGAHYGGIGGALLAQGMSLLVVHPMIARLAWRHRSWDPLQDLVTGTATLAVVAAIVLLRMPALSALMP
ncbi:MAG: oligosaccharide flippase family protein [Rhodobacteraceae bacterium]|nr:oligosaccharide flippase family protein [Paracoccaceae bacterium]